LYVRPAAEAASAETVDALAKVDFEVGLVTDHAIPHRSRT